MLKDKEGLVHVALKGISTQASMSGHTLPLYCSLFTSHVIFLPGPLMKGRCSARMSTVSSQTDNYSNFFNFKFQTCERETVATIPGVHDTKFE